MSEYIERDDLLYHYCSLSEFIDTIANKSIILKDIEKVDKYTNLSKTIDLFIQRLEQRFSIILKEKSEDSFFLTIPLMTLKDGLKKYRYTIEPAFYSYSLTDYCDNWSLFNNKANDISIGIPFSKTSSALSTSPLYVKRITYGYEELCSKIDSAIDTYLDDYLKKEKLKESGPDLELFAYKNIWNYIKKDLVYESVLFKDTYFADEHEFRLIVPTHLYLHSNIENYQEQIKSIVNFSIQNDIFSLSKLKFTVENNDLISYRHLIFNNIAPLISAVYINPTIQASVNDIEMLLSSYDCNSTAVYKRQLN